MVGQKPAILLFTLEGPMPRAVIILIILIFVIGGALIFLSSRAHQVPTHPVEVDVTNAAASH